MNNLKNILGVFIKNTNDNIIPKQDIVKKSLVIVIAIMSFLCTSGLASVHLLNKSVKQWNSDIGTEAMIEIMPRENHNIEQDLKNASEIAMNFGGIYDTEILTVSATKKLLQPWLGNNVNYNDLPIARIIILHLNEDINFDSKKFTNILKTSLPNANFNNKHAWVKELKTMATNCAIIVGFIVLLLSGTLIITIVFATLSAVNANKPIIEILHFLSADQSYIIQQFDTVFLHKAFQGTALGAITTMMLFYILHLLRTYSLNYTHLYAFFGNFKLGFMYYIEMFLLLFFVVILTVITCRATILKQLHNLENNIN